MVKDHFDPNIKTWVYCFVRLDLPLHQQLVQAAHACLESGNVFCREHRATSLPSSLVILGIPDADALEAVEDYLGMLLIDFETFFEPDYVLPNGLPYEFTALATLPVFEEQRHLFSQYSLWRPPVKLTLWQKLKCLFNVK